MSGAKRILPLLAALCFALFLLYGVYFNAFGANAESMMAFFDITESRQGFVMTIQSLGGIVMTVLLGLFGERLHKLYGLGRVLCPSAHEDGIHIALIQQQIQLCISSGPDLIV